MSEATLSSKNQIVIPREARAALGLAAGDRLLVVVHRDQLVIRKKPKRYAKALLGLGKDLYSPDHLKRERESWQ